MIQLNLTKANQLGLNLVEPTTYFKSIWERTNSYIQAATIMRTRFNILVTIKG